MGLLILIAVGAVFGWFGSIVTRTEDVRGILWHAGAGTAGALVAGIATNSGSVLIGLGGWALLAAIAGAVAGVAALNFWQQRAAR